MPPADVETASSSLPQGSCYRIQVLVVGRHKRWRDEVSTQVRMLGYQVTACDRGVDAMTVLALGLPVDVMVVDTALQGGLCCAQLAVESRALSTRLGRTRRPACRTRCSSGATSSRTGWSSRPCARRWRTARPEVRRDGPRRLAARRSNRARRDSRRRRASAQVRDCRDRNFPPDVSNARGAARRSRCSTRVIR